MSRIFGAVRQNGYVVRDIGAALRHWTGVLGVGPFFYIESIKCDWFHYHGAPSPIEMSLALANSGDLQIELIQQHNDAPSMYHDFLQAGREGLHHVAYWTKNYRADYERALSLGYKVGHEGQASGPNTGFVYFDTETHPGTVVELSDVSGPKGVAFEQIRQASIGWDGENPVRSLG